MTTSQTRVFANTDIGPAFFLLGWSGASPRQTWQVDLEAASRVVVHSTQLATRQPAPHEPGALGRDVVLSQQAEGKS
jgi:hypothetical protein